MTTGMDLKVERVRARATAQRLADVLDVSRQRISGIEALAVVHPDLAERYRDALASLTTGAEIAPAEAAS
jgi:DNA-binding XRE family transcriptional regulator